MMTRVPSSPEWGPRPPDQDRANGARIYDCLLGGAYNFAVDREAVRQLLAINPDADKVAKSNRQFVMRAVRFCVSAGIDQFLDLGSGVPTVGNVHEIAQAARPDARVLYVDHERIAFDVTRSLLGDNPCADAVHADLRQPEVIFATPQAGRLLDLTRPIAVMMNAALHYVPDSDDVAGILAAYRERMAAGSYFVFSHLANTAQLGQRVFSDSGTPITLRTRDEMADLLRDFELVDPGLVYVPDWRPVGDEIYADQPQRSKCYGAVGRTS